MLKTLVHWRNGVRLYIAIGIGLVTLETWWWASVSYHGSILFATRLEEVFAWLAIVLLGLAVLIGPLYKVWPKLPGKWIMFDARRMIGIGAAWFAFLHAAIVYISLFKVVNPLNLPVTYQKSFILGVTGLIILLALAFTSFDKAFRGMGIWWFRLHRLVYIAILVSLLHAFMTNVHATRWFALSLLIAAAMFTIGLHIYLAFKRGKPTVWQVTTIVLMLVSLLLIFAYGTASAHVLKQNNGTAAILHVPPDDNPVAGEPAELDFSFGDDSGAFKLPNCDCFVVIKKDAKVVTKVTPKPAQPGATLDGIVMQSFPAAGAYDVVVTGSPKNGATFQPFELSFIVRVSAATSSKTSGQANQVVIISLGSLAILTLFAYTNITTGGRYRPKKGKS